MSTDSSGKVDPQEQQREDSATLNDERTVGYSQSYVPQFRERVAWVLFPQRHCSAPEMANSHDVVVSHVTIELSVIDRVRLFISGRLRVAVKTTTENVIGKCATESTASVLPPKILDRSDSGASAKQTRSS